MDGPVWIEFHSISISFGLVWFSVAKWNRLACKYSRNFQQTCHSISWLSAFHQIQSKRDKWLVYPPRFKLDKRVNCYNPHTMPFFTTNNTHFMHFTSVYKINVHLEKSFFRYCSLDHGKFYGVSGCSSNMFVFFCHFNSLKIRWRQR